MTLVELYSKEECHLCDEAKAVIERVQKRIQFKLREIKLTPGDPYFEEYKEMFPVVHINKVQVFKYRVSENMLKIKLQQVAIETRAPDDPEAPSVDRKR
ncbi:MAG: glutaredoxin 2 [Bacteroidetes bacterium]|nr:glutaredoxin 2 [Bacteroidota bacterium]